jgi:aryl-alcohol dehydrogenase-like predicted oxidoreductase
MEFARIDGIPVPVSRIVMGTDWLGARRFVFLAGRCFISPWVDRRRERDNFALLDGVVEAGCTAFDTARAYPDSERSLGAWLRERGLRERLVIISKGGHPGPRWAPRLTSADVTRDLEQSLKALGTDTIDLYLLHYDDPTAPIEPLVDTLNRHLAAGKVRAIGVSNWPTRRIAAAADYAAAAGRTPFVASSVQFSLASWQRTPWPNAVSISGDGAEAEAERRWYRDRRLHVLAYSSLAMGFFSRARPYAGGPSATPAKADRFGDQVFVNDRNLARLARATDLAARRGVSPGQIALAWVLGYDSRVLALVGARTVASYVDAVGAFAVPLSESEREWLSHGPSGR